jgi:hypothetical protein
MHPNIRRDLARLRQLDHVHRRRVAAFAAGAAFQRRFQLPDRRILRPADGIERQARAGLAAVALDLEPGEPAIDALPDRRRWLRRTAVALHADRPRFGLRAVGLANGFPGGFLRALGADFRAPDAAAVECLAGLGAHGKEITAALAAECNAPRIRGWERPGHTKASSMCNLYSIVTNQAAMSALFRVMNRYRRQPAVHRR